MTQLLINKLRRLAGCIALLVVFLAMGTVEASAQSTAAPLDNPETAIAQYLGVNACVLGTATNVQGGISAIEAQLISLRAAGQTSDMLTNLKIRYYAAVIHDVRDFDIYPEISLLTNLKFVKNITGGNPSVSQFANLYNATKASFGMCQ